MPVKATPWQFCKGQPRTRGTLPLLDVGRGVAGRLVVRPWLATLGMSVLVTAVSSCSTTSISRVKGPDNYTQKGVRYYGSTPYIFVSAPVQLKAVDELYKLDLGANTLTLISGCPGPKCPAGAPAAIVGGRPPAPPLPAEAAPATGSGKGGAPSPGSNAQASPASGGDSASSSPTKGAASIAIVWLPDYCEQYSVEIDNVLSTVSLKLKLNNGWQFDNIDVSNDSTTVISKVLDTLSGVTSLASPAKAKPTSVPAGVATFAKEAPSAKEFLFRRSVTESLQPGVYSLFERRGCEVLPVFNPRAFPTLTTETWELVPQPEGR